MRTPNLKILTGPTGSGKTHRLRALEREHAQARPGAKVLCVAAAELLALLICSLREEVPEVFGKLPDRGFSLVLIDDLDPARLGRRTRIEFARLLSGFLRADYPGRRRLTVGQRTRRTLIQTPANPMRSRGIRGRAGAAEIGSKLVAQQKHHGRPSTPMEPRGPEAARRTPAIESPKRVDRPYVIMLKEQHLEKWGCLIATQPQMQAVP